MTLPGAAPPGGPPPDPPLAEAATRFTAAMNRLAPFEPAPHLAVAVSGGPDSLAVAHLADTWARAQGGRITALTVDHGLRAEAAGEAAAVGRLMAARGIAHEVLVWRPTTVAHRSQAAARRARYALLEAACRRHGILHLVVAHTADDQGETVLLRLAKGSGPDGLAGMPALSERHAVRLLRPLLGWRKSALRSVCAAAGLAAIDDPSNLSPSFARGRLRRAAAALTREGLTTERLAALARRAAPARCRSEALVADGLAEAAAVYPEGFARLALDPWRRRPGDIRLAMLARLIRAVGAADHAPREAALARLAARLEHGPAPASTLGGCRLVVAADHLIVAREAAAAGERRPVLPGQTVLWDRRLTVSVPADLAAPQDEPMVLARLGQAAGRAIPSAAWPVVPAPARAALPGLWTAGGHLVATAAVACARPDRLPTDPAARLAVVFTPPSPIADAGFVAA